MVYKCQSGSVTSRLAISYVRFFILLVISPYWIKSYPEAQLYSPSSICTLTSIGQTKSGAEFLTSYLLVLRMVLIHEGCSRCYWEYLTCITIMRAPDFINPLANSVEQNKNWTLFVLLPHTHIHTYTQASLNFHRRSVPFLLCSFEISVTWAWPVKTARMCFRSAFPCKSNHAHWIKELLRTTVISI